MNAQEAFAHFVRRVLLAEKAERFTYLSTKKKGQRKILDGLCHQFESAIRPGSVRTMNYEPLLNRPCFVFSVPMGFGMPFDTLGEAYDKLSIEDSWLIVLADASAGIHRPEARW